MSANRTKYGSMGAARSNWGFGVRRYNSWFLADPRFYVSSVVRSLGLLFCDCGWQGIAVVKMGVSGQPKTSFLILQLFVIFVSPCCFLDVVLLCFFVVILCCCVAGHLQLFMSLLDYVAELSRSCTTYPFECHAYKSPPFVSLNSSP
ncbi:hypothetical protein QVD17_00260 [Tagetes erecta]|uniref:Uncharacterized protein n=1 Tax=Tagetes erecta TaxID=13708 RepID=A0AAD8L8B3_TARER|nr:hypothetical protein QVD17_00260 [Tagetes erecta]